MSLYTLKLEDFVFDHLEIPERIPFGGEQMHYVHKMPGGVRSVDAMGVDYQDLEWTGMFDGLTALFRARYLENLMVKGKPVKCTYGPFSYIVLIKKFTCDFKIAPLPYSISVVVIENLSNPISFLLPSAFEDVLIADISEVLRLASLLKFGGLLGAVSLLYESMLLISSYAEASISEIAHINEQANSALNINTGIIDVTKQGLFPS